MINLVISILELKSNTHEIEVHPSGNTHAFYFDQKFEHGFMWGVIGDHYDVEMVYIYWLFPTSLPRRAYVLY